MRAWPFYPGLCCHVAIFGVAVEPVCERSLPTIQLGTWPQLVGDRAIHLVQNRGPFTPSGQCPHTFATEPLEICRIPVISLTLIGMLLLPACGLRY